jgi:hypothetical protein
MDQPTTGTGQAWSINPFTSPGEWYKGSLHIHTTASDGQRTRTQAIEEYRQRGYHFVAVTDHAVVSEPELLADDMLVLPGVEWDGIDPHRGTYHLVALGLAGPNGLSCGHSQPMQAAIDHLRDAGAIVSVAHPHCLGLRSGDLVDLDGCFGLEIFNASHHAETAKGYSLTHWDDLLANARRISGLAVDDVHWKNGEYDAGLGWVWVKAPKLSQSAILTALEEGTFYASTGPRIHDLRLDLERLEISVRCSPARVIDFVGDNVHSRRCVPNRSHTLTMASHRLSSKQLYVRVACQDIRGCWAWSNPFFLP